MKVRIIKGFAEGLTGTATKVEGLLADWYDVELTYPQGFDECGYDLSGVTEKLYYYPDEVEVIDEPSE